MKMFNRGRALLVGGLLLLIAGDVSAQPIPTQCVTNAVAGGTGDAITVPLLPCGLQTNLLLLTLAAANTTTSPTLQMTGFPAQPILNAAGGSLAAGNLPGAGAVVLLSSTGSSWLLLSNGAAATTGASSNTTVSVFTGTGNVNMSVGQQMIVVRKAVPASTTVTLPAGSNWPGCPTLANGCPTIIVKDGAGNANSFPIVLTTPDGKNIDGATAYGLVFNYQSVEVTYDGTQWNVR